MDSQHIAMPSLEAIFDGARHFGLIEREIWRTVDECLEAMDQDATVAEYIDELTGALARRVLAKQRRVSSTQARVPSTRRRVASQDLSH
jgi:hypothetical protein